MTYREMETQLGQPMYTRPAPETVESPVETGWVPQQPGELPESFQQLVAALCEVAGSREELERLRSELESLYAAKAVVYQDERGIDSCFKRGLFGLFHNLARKWDRIETVGIRLGVSGGAAVAAEAAADGEADPETLYKTVRDLVVYGIHTLRWLQGERAHGQHSV